MRHRSFPLWHNNSNLESLLSSSAIIPALVTSLAASILLLARAVWRIGYGTRKRNWIEAFYAVLSIGAVSFIAIDLIHQSRSLFSPRLEIYAEAGCLFLCVLMTFFVFRTVTLHGSAKALRRSAHSWLLILVASAMTSWTYHRIMVRSLGVDFLGAAEVLPGTLEQDSLYVATTDAGTSIQLYRLETSEREFEEYASLLEDKLNGFIHLGILRQDADKMANCHGWVFTDGRFLLRGTDVDSILCDNNYYIVSDPKPGDIMIYRNEVGNILHTALVQGVLIDGSVILESKWGVDQRFLHLPANQPYSQCYDYYRTTRPNHLITVRESTLHDD